MAALTSIALGTAIAGAATSAYGQYKAGKAAKAAADSEAERLEYNAGIADMQAKDAIARGREEEGKVRSEVRRVVGTQRAGFAGQGVDIGVGSARDVQADAAHLGELDALTVRNNAAREAWGYQVEAGDLRRGADISRRTGKNALTAAKWGAATSIIGTGSSLLMQRYGWSDKSSVVGPTGRAVPQASTPILESRRASGASVYTSPSRIG